MGGSTLGCGAASCLGGTEEQAVTITISNAVAVSGLVMMLAIPLNPFEG